MDYTKKTNKQKSLPLKGDNINFTLIVEQFFPFFEGNRVQLDRTPKPRFGSQSKLTASPPLESHSNHSIEANRPRQ